jgi:phage shock protein C
MSPPRKENTMAKRLLRSAHQKMLGGVCAGLAEYLDIDVSVVRLLWVGIALVTALLPMTLFYIIAWIVIPQAPLSSQS